MNISFNNIKNSDIDSLLLLAQKKYLEVEEYVGCLLDNYIIENDNSIYITEHITEYNTHAINATSKYIIIYEKALDEWSSCYNVIMTDDEEEVNKYKNLFTN